jgi:putative colanic acid biosynthesis UDP-glucose lipid carrier transferase
MLNAIYLLAYYLTNNRSTHSEWQVHYLIVCNLFWLINSFLFRLYSEYDALTIEKIYRATWKTIVLHGIFFTFYLFFSNDNEFSRVFLLVFYGLLVVASILNRFLGTVFQYILLSKLKLTKSVAIMGNNYTAARLKNYLKVQKNVQFYGFIGTHQKMLLNSDGTLPAKTVDEIKAAVDAGVKDLYVCITPELMGNIKPLIYEADRQLLRLKFIPDMYAALAPSYTMSYIGGEFPMITVRNEPLEKMSNRFKKRAFDILFSLLVIFFILTWLYPIIALLIKLESRGPVLFRQERSGRNDISFWCYKFRSMKINDSSNSRQATLGDERITKVGGFLRKTSLDELPQFLNVLQGFMSVVGPRPHMLKHTEQYRAIIDKFMVRHFCKPGITGWAQVNGLRGETKATKNMEMRIEHDIHYVENWSLMWDVKIIFLTIINVVRGEDNAF